MPYLRLIPSRVSTIYRFWKFKVFPRLLSLQVGRVCPQTIVIIAHLLAKLSSGSMCDVLFKIIIGFDWYCLLLLLLPDLLYRDDVAAEAAGWQMLLLFAQSQLASRSACHRPLPHLSEKRTLKLKYARTFPSYKIMLRQSFRFQF